MTKITDVTDRRGRKLEPGAKVAFNLSGYLALGVVEEAVVTKEVKTSYSPYVRRTYRIKVRLAEDNAAVGKLRGHQSTLRTPDVLLVLDDFPTR